MKETEITIKVKLDQNNIPEEIMWSAPDGGMKDQLSKAIFLSFWDSRQKETLKMDLWTKEMPIDEMKTFMLQTLQSMNQTISKAIGNEDLIKIIVFYTVPFYFDALYAELRIHDATLIPIHQPSAAFVAMLFLLRICF